MVAGYAVCVDHGWLRVATYVATMVSARHAMVPSRNLCRNYGLGSSCCGFESQSGVSTPQHLLILHSLYYPMKFMQNYVLSTKHVLLSNIYPKWIKQFRFQIFKAPSKHIQVVLHIFKTHSSSSSHIHNTNNPYSTKIMNHNSLACILLWQAFGFHSSINPTCINTQTLRIQTQVKPITLIHSQAYITHLNITMHYLIIIINITWKLMNRLLEHQLIMSCLQFNVKII